MSKSVGIRELKNQTSQILREVREEQIEYVVTHQGRPVAVLRPFVDEDAHLLREAELQAAMQRMKALAIKVGAAWTSPKSGVELVDEQRR